MHPIAQVVGGDQEQRRPSPVTAADGTNAVAATRTGAPRNRSWITRRTASSCVTASVDRDACNAREVTDAGSSAIVVRTAVSGERSARPVMTEARNATTTTTRPIAASAPA
ncbi:hypothetical protein ACRAWB_10085 [Leifsonia poae]|uniref:hypothetical protein n=1 Tax=Leifsonia poae TaxID=110933 RepID=UPI003D68A43D